MLLALLLGQGPTVTQVGRVTVVAWPEQQALGASLAEIADHDNVFPGLIADADHPFRLILAPNRQKYDSLTRGRLPLWSEGAAFPDNATIVLLTRGPSDRLTTALRHELAHLVLRWQAGRRAPLWFEEGYAAVAAEEWDRLDALRLNVQLARGVRMNLDDVDRALRGARGDAETGYGLATSAVALLARWGGDRGLGPLLANLREAESFDAALRATYHVTESDFELRWQKDVRSRYGWVSWFTAMGFFWVAIGALLVALVGLRRRRDKRKRAALEADDARDAATAQMLDELGTDE